MKGTTHGKNEVDDSDKFVSHVLVARGLSTGCSSV